MADCQEVNLVLGHVERVDDSIISNPERESDPILLIGGANTSLALTRSRQSWLPRVRASQMATSRRPRRSLRSKSELQRSGAFGLAHPRSLAVSHVAFGLLDRILEIGCELQIVFNDVIEPFTNLTKLRLR